MQAGSSGTHDGPGGWSGGDQWDHRGPPPGQPPRPAGWPGAYRAAYPSDPLYPDAYHGGHDRRQASPVDLTLASFLVLMSGIVMMVGSVTAWLTATALGHKVSITGTQITSGLLNGWFTFIAGITLLVLGGLLAVSDDAAVRLLAILASFTSLGLAVYDLIRVLHLTSKAHPPASGVGSIGGLLSGGEGLGFGLILVLVAATGAVLASLAARRW